MPRDIESMRERTTNRVSVAIIDLAVFMLSVDKEFEWSEVMNEIAANIEPDLVEIRKLLNERRAAS